MIPYRIIWSYSMPDLQKQVNEFIGKGYEPQGGVAVTGQSTDGSEVFYQAVVLQRATRVPTNTVITGEVDKPGRLRVDNPEDKKARTKK